MKYHELTESASPYQSNIRAEDGLQKNGGWNSFYEGVLIPCGVVLALILVLFVGMSIRY
jgi:hypothetical protein